MGQRRAAARAHAIADELMADVPRNPPERRERQERLASALVSGGSPGRLTAEEILFNSDSDSSPPRGAPGRRRCQWLDYCANSRSREQAARDARVAAWPFAPPALRFQLPKAPQEPHTQPKQEPMERVEEPMEPHSKPEELTEPLKELLGLEGSQSDAPLESLQEPKGTGCARSSQQALRQPPGGAKEPMVKLQSQLQAPMREPEPQEPQEPPKGTQAFSQEPPEPRDRSRSRSPDSLHRHWEYFRRGPRLASATRNVLRWASGRDDARQLVDAARQIRYLAVAHDWLEPRERVESRVSKIVHAEERQYKRGKRASVFYVGSTSDPTWRWQGGHYHRAPDGELTYMPGHRLAYNRMYIIGCWPDSQAAAIEVRAITAARICCKASRVANIALDARGLELRPYAYSFVYVCVA